ncbi:hypothetical protein [Streptomyces sp. NRRL B-24720]|uniref:hypothetical protein n=1 Tax=Streptomyces sp. NRRL B-24720 TaxID=1476876 RepID=UPI0004C578AB|nr:hypothetical protein [Streptomyces sp. NRRL B-24720]
MTAPGSLPWAAAPEENRHRRVRARGGGIQACGGESGPVAGDAKALAEDLNPAEADVGVRSEVR